MPGTDTPTEKEQLHIRLLVAGSVFELGMAAASAFESGDGDAFAPSEPLTSHVPCVSVLLRDERLLPKVVDFYRKMQMRGLITLVFELIKNYCYSTGQLDTLKGTDWYWYARVVRNCLSHDFVISYRRAKDIQAKLPIVWNGREFTEAMEGQRISMGHLDLAGTVDLYDESVEFADQLPDAEQGEQVD